MEYSYSITKEVLTNHIRLVWNHCYRLTFDVNNSSKKKSICLDLNIKDNQPCLHFRYEGFKINVGDRFCLLDFSNSPIIDCEVVKRPHNSTNNIKEVDFILLREDLQSLKKRASYFHRIYIKHHNGDAPTEIRNQVPDYFRSIQMLDGLPEELRQLLGLDISYKEAKHKDNYFKRYVGSYFQALKSIGLEKNMNTPNNIQNISSNRIGLTVSYDYCYVYLMHDKRNGYHKIGISKEPKYREKTLQSEQPAIEMVCNKRYPSRKIAEAIESALHKAYAEQRVRGEWFDLSPEDVIMLKESLT